MFFKASILVACVAACYGAEHAYSSQSIVRYDQHHEQSHQQHAVPVLHKVAVPVVTKVAVPVKLALPVAHYVSTQQESQQSHGYSGQQSGGHAAQSHGYSGQSQGYSGQSHGYSGQSQGYSGQSQGYSGQSHGYSGQSQGYSGQSQGYSGQSHGHSGQSQGYSGQSQGYSGQSHGYSGQSHGYSGESHGHAISSQSIHREDVPAKAPADFYEHHGPAKYEFEYKVEDPHTGDNKFQKESRDGYSVKGVYSLHEADGSIRTVDYSSDKHQGFNANIKHSTKHIEQPKYHH